MFALLFKKEQYRGVTDAISEKFHLFCEDLSFFHLRI